MHSSTFQRWLCFSVTAVILSIVVSIPAYATSDDDLWSAACAKVNQGRLAEARPIFKRIVDFFPASRRAPGAQLKLAYIKMRLDQPTRQDMLDAFSAVKQKYPASDEAGEALVRIGYIHSKSDTVEAIKDFSAFVTSRPNHPLNAEACQSLGRLYLRTHELDKAETAFDRVKLISNADEHLVDEAALQSGFVKIMRFYASKDKTRLTAAIEAFDQLRASPKVNVRARADLGTAEALLLLGKPTEARAKYTAAVAAYSDNLYFRGIALYGVACCSRHAGKLDDAVADYAALMAAMPGQTLAEKDAAWLSAALASTSTSAQITIQENGSWTSLPGSEIVVESVYNRSKCLYLLKRYDEAIEKLNELVQYLPESNPLRAEAILLIEKCNRAKGRQQ